MSPEDRSIINARIDDAAKRCLLRCRPEFVGFIDKASAVFAVSAAGRAGCGYMLYGGYPEAERCFFGAFPPVITPDRSYFPVDCIKILNKSKRKLSHRDILGALMSLGIERDTVGDILTGDGTAVVFVCRSITDFVLSNLTKIASCGVDVSVDNESELPFAPEFEEHTDTVASARLDCIVASAANTSRGKAAELIGAGLVSLNGLEAVKTDKSVFEGDILAIRHVGKFAVDSLSDISRKGRVIFRYRKYL